jgi:hypothetical protein
MKKWLALTELRLSPPEVEHRQFVQKEHALVCQADLTRAGTLPPPTRPASLMV